jgi:ABC-2 type transport system permease protein
MAFIAGAFFSPSHFPEVLRALADVLPLTYFLRLIRNVMLHDQAIWSQGTNIAVLAVWGIVGVIVALRAFRWEPHEG